jgi:hypothetical protein
MEHTLAVSAGEVNATMVILVFGLGLAGDWKRTATNNTEEELGE